MELEALNEEKHILIERLGVHIEKKDNIPPLAARILSTLIPANIAESLVACL